MTITFNRTYKCNCCGATQSLEDGNLELWTDCAECHGPAHWCYAIPCEICPYELIRWIDDETAPEQTVETLRAEL
jgi:hypothetical protein